MFAYAAKEPVKTAEQSRPNRTGLPAGLKAGLEAMSGLSMDYVRVHYNSPEPAQFRALAYTRGTEIHIAPGQEKHLPHEAWHTVQQLRGRVKPTAREMNAAVNEDPALEREADMMGSKAAKYQGSAGFAEELRGSRRAFSDTVQFVKGSRGESGTFLSAGTFDLYFRFYSTLGDKAWGQLKASLCKELKEHAVFQDNAPFEGGGTRKQAFAKLFDSIIEDTGDTTTVIKLNQEEKNAIIKKLNEFNELNRLDELVMLYVELARFRFYREAVSDESEAPPQKKWKLGDGSVTDDPKKFVNDAIGLFRGKAQVEPYVDVIAAEVADTDYDNYNEKQYFYDRTSGAMEKVQAGATYVVYRAMKPEEYNYLKKYFDTMKTEVDAIYAGKHVTQDSGNIAKIIRLFGKNGFSDSKLPIGAHLGDFEQVAGYLNRTGSDERVLVKFFIKDSMNLINSVKLPEGGGEGRLSIGGDAHHNDKIGSKLEYGTFSFNLGKNKWAGFKFLSFVERIEVMNPSAIKGEPA